jgi:hypothetical protein
LKSWETIADNLKRAGFSLGWVSTLDREGRRIWIVEAHRDGKSFIVRADGKTEGVSRTEIAAYPDPTQCRPLVFVDCQFGLKEGKMKSSSKSRKMDEPLSFN